ncbi:putative phage baseplate assembly protein [Kribbella orskensis]|uniref:Phage baseplate assembly protein n=1 Tax=Kribbella orskensis TaxID=2512216 RepID=A0ABY2BBT3_9ACTN|nr:MULTISPECIES: putative baseplate assembly protein [Kribbella]TCN32787.1 putative phage baseplate assembly protein [Kribbella sp. VKM Ac-2500]TCO12895.1 putative phage baseplate assembly protein [Kribbella orskensis]
MTLIGPILDDRTFDELRAELLQRIPAYAPEWTNHNASDPGIALLELFAFLGESLLYRFNQIPEATKVAFLRLLDVAPIPARPARVLAVAETERPGGVQVLAKSELKGGAVSFETDGELYVWPLDALGIGKVKVLAPPEADAQESARRQDATRRLGLAGAAAVQFYEAAILPAELTPDNQTVVDVDSTADRALWVPLLRRDTTDVDELAGRTVFIGVALDDSIEKGFDLGSLDDKAAARYRSTGLDAAPPAALWRLWNPPAKKQVTPADSPGTFTALEVTNDSTEGLTTSGVVAITLPKSLPKLLVPPTGLLGSPPPLDGPEASRVIAWLQLSRPQNENDVIGRVRWVGANAVLAIQARTAQPELLGVGTGEADQAVELQYPPVLPGTIELDVEEAGRWREWTEVDRFTGEHPTERVYAVDLAAGQVRFGPGGPQARVPQIGERIRVRSYRYGGGVAGNVPAGSVNKLVGIAGVKLTNPLPAWGGRDTEALGDTLDRIPAEVHRRDRAVTPDDFRELASQVTGVHRAETLPFLHPDNPTDNAAGVVSVVVFPDQDLRNPGAPLPDRSLLRRVARHLDQRRLVTTELYVLPPEYRRIAVAAGVVVRAGYQVDAVRRWVELILRQFLAPVPPYGPDGTGWPLGRIVRAAELEAVAVQVEGVDYLAGLQLATVDGDVLTKVPLVQLRRWQVPEVTEVTVVEGTPLDAGQDYQPLPPSTPAGTVQVPLPRVVC